MPQNPTPGPPLDTESFSLWMRAPSLLGPVTRKSADVMAWIVAKVKTLFVSRADLEGHEDDVYAGGYDEGLLQAGVTDKRFAWAVASTDGSAAPLEADLYDDVEDIAAGARTLVVGATQWGGIVDNDPTTPLPAEAAVTAEEAAAIANAHSASPPDGTNYPAFAATGAATKVGAGNGAYWWIPVTVTIHGDLSAIEGEDGADSANGNVWRLSSEEPSDLDVSLSWHAIADPPWLKRDGGNAADLAAAFAQKIVAGLEGLASAWLKRLRLLVQGNNETQTLTVTRVAGVPAAAGQILLQGGIANNGAGQVVLWPPAATKDGTPFAISDLKEFQEGDFLSLGGLEWEIGDTPWSAFQGSVVQANVVLADGYTFNAGDVPALNASADLTLEGRDIHLGLVIAAILKRAAANIGGKGGAAGKVWGYLSNATNATWRALIDVLEADASTVDRRAQYREAIATGRLTKSVAGNSNILLTTRECAYDSHTYSGLKTGDVILTWQDRPTGIKLLRNQSTGAFALKLKAAGQANAAAVTLAAGDNVVLLHGGSVALLTEMRRWVNGDIGMADEAIAKNLHEDDFVYIYCQGTDGSDKNDEETSFRFGDLEGTDRYLLGTGADGNTALLVSKNGTTLQARRNSVGLSAAESIVYAQRRTYNTQSLA